MLIEQRSLFGTVLCSVFTLSEIFMSKNWLLLQLQEIVGLVFTKTNEITKLRNKLRATRDAAPAVLTQSE